MRLKGKVKQQGAIKRNYKDDKKHNNDEVMS